MKTVIPPLILNGYNISSLLEGKVTYIEVSSKFVDVKLF
jgi:hypothetical protein